MIDKKPKTEAVKKQAEPRKGFKESGEAYPGVDPDTGERKAATFDGLVAEFGKKKGEEIYFKISEIGGHGVEQGGPVEFRPDLSLNMAKDKRAEVDKLFEAKE